MRYMILSLLLVTMASAAPRTHHWQLDGSGYAIAHHQGWNCKAAHDASWTETIGRPKRIEIGLPGARALKLGTVDYLVREPNPAYIDAEKTPDESPTRIVTKQHHGMVGQASARAVLDQLRADQDLRWDGSKVVVRADKTERVAGRKAARVLAIFRQLEVTRLVRARAAALGKTRVVTLCDGEIARLHAKVAAQ